MTQQEAIEHYNIPVSILQEYESWGLCGAVKNVMCVWQYDDENLERLSTILTLHDIGFTTEEVETYLPGLDLTSSTANKQVLSVVIALVIADNQTCVTFKIPYTIAAPNGGLHQF